MRKSLEVRPAPRRPVWLILAFTLWMVAVIAATTFGAIAGSDARIVRIEAAE